jgi:hypothetical protein
MNLRACVEERRGAARQMDKPLEVAQQQRRLNVLFQSGGDFVTIVGRDKRRQKAGTAQQVHAVSLMRF